MRFRDPLVKVIVTVILLLAVVTPRGAATVPIRGGSGYGPSSFSFSDCANGTFSLSLTSSGCEEFLLAPFTLDENGLNFQVFQFAFNTSPGNSGTILDVFEIGNVGAGSSFFVPLLNPSLDTGVFFCNNGTNPFAIDSSPGFNNGVPIPPSPLTGLPCTVGLSGTLQNPTIPSMQETPQQNGIMFLTTGSFADLTFFTQDGNLGSTAATTPEPASVVLLGTGLLALAGRPRRRLAVTVQ